jgi:predicted nucleotidyltransferase
MEELKGHIIGLMQSYSYEFLDTEPDLEKVVYLAASGSYGYGTYTDESDLDLRGVLIEPDDCLFGLRSFEQYESKETDTVIYGLKKFAKLCLQANPNCLEILGLEEDTVVIESEASKLLRENAHLFLSKGVSKTFGNYALAQMNKLKNSLAKQAGAGSHEKADALSLILESFNHRFKLPEGAIRAYSRDSEILVDVDVKGISATQVSQLCSELNSMLKSHLIKPAGPAKSEKQLLKHAMHLVRLPAMAVDILEGKGIATYRRNDHELLMDIRGGKYSFDEIFEIANEHRAKLDEAAKSTKLPDKPDAKNVEKLIERIYKLNLQSESLI